MRVRVFGAFFVSSLNQGKKTHINIKRNTHINTNQFAGLSRTGWVANFVYVVFFIKICPRALLRSQNKMRPKNIFWPRFRIGSSRCVSNLLRSGGNTCACATFPSTRCGMWRGLTSHVLARDHDSPDSVGNCPSLVDFVGFSKCHISRTLASEFRKT